MAQKIYNVIFLCSGNSARSIMAEALMNHWGKRRFCAFSAGSSAKGEVHPLALELLTQSGLKIQGLRSKGWNEFAKPEAPSMDFVFTVCDKVAEEECPAWPGEPMTAHWGVADPAVVEGSVEVRKRAFYRAFRELENRIKLFISLRLDELDRLSLSRRLDEIGRVQRGDL